MKCQSCKTNEATWNWQPDGLNEDPRQGFTAFGWHYRGFPVIKVCGACKDNITDGNDVQFQYKGKSLLLQGGDIKETT